MTTIPMLTTTRDDRRVDDENRQPARQALDDRDRALPLDQLHERRDAHREERADVDRDDRVANREEDPRGEDADDGGDNGEDDQLPRIGHRGAAAALRARTRRLAAGRRLRCRHVRRYSRVKLAMSS